MSSAQSYRKYIEFAVLCLLAAALLWWFGRNLDWSEVGHAVGNADPFLLIVAVLIISAAYFVRAFLLGALLKPLSAARFSDLFAATTIGFSAVFLLGRAGEVVRPVALSMRDPRIRPSASLVTIIVERICDMSALALMFAINLIWFKPPSTLGVSFDRVRTAGMVLFGATVVGIAFLTWFRSKSDLVIRLVEGLFARLRFIPQRLTKLVLGILQQLAQALRVLVNLTELLETIGWTGLLWFAIAAANLLVMRAFHLPVGFPETIFVLGWALVGSLVPTQSVAAGSFHAATATGLLFIGVKNRETAAALAIVLHLVDFGPALLFGLFYVIRGDLSLTKLRKMISPPSEEVQLR